MTLHILTEVLQADSLRPLFGISKIYVQIRLNCYSGNMNSIFEQLEILFIRGSCLFPANLF
jgi:hypothetical protein